MAAFDAEESLPRNGLLSFFYDAGGVRPDADGGIWGFDPADVGGARVLHLIDGAVRRRRPEEDGAVLAERGLRPRHTLTLPPWESAEVESLGFTRSDLDLYVDRLVPSVEHARGREDEGPVHQLLGHPDQIQGDMRLECQLVTNGLYCGDSTGYQDPRAAQLAEGAADWRLLLEVDSDEKAGAMWGDVGYLYYWIREPDLRAGAFDASWLVLQCY